MRRTTLPLIAALIAVSAAGPAGAATSTVSMRDDQGEYFTRAFIVVRPGDRVRWSNETNGRHTVTSYPSAPDGFDSSPQTPNRSTTQSDPCAKPLLGNERDCIKPGKTFSVTFREEGTYRYYCKAHGDPSVEPDPGARSASQPCGMCATVVVKAEVEPPQPTRSTAKATNSARPTATASARRSPTPTATVDGATDTSPLAGKGPGGGGGSGGRTAIALVLIVALGSAGWWTWRRFLTPS